MFFFFVFVLWLIPNKERVYMSYLMNKHVSLSLMRVDNALALLPTEILKLSLGDDWPLGSVCLLVKGFKIIV